MNEHELNKKTLRFARAVLDDEHGISEAAYAHMLDLFDYLKIDDVLLKQDVEASEGRFFIP